MRPCLKILEFPGFLCLGAVLGARKAAKEACTMTALPYRTTTQHQSLTTMAQTERAANQGPTKLRLENYIGGTEPKNP